MTEFLVRHFVKNYEETEKVSVRTAYGVLASVVGIFCNVFLFAVKWMIGFFLHSIAVMADGALLFRAFLAQAQTAKKI